MPTPTIGTQVFVVVAQRPFSPAESYTQFCNLVPVAYGDGASADRSDFPHNGQIWWMLAGNHRQFAEPGRLLSARLEHASRQELGKSRFQVEMQSVHPVREDELIEVLTVPSSAVNDLRGLVSAPGPITINRPPTDRVFVRWRDRLYGPLHTEVEQLTDRYAFRVAFRPTRADAPVYEVDPAELAKIGLDYVGVHKATVTTQNVNVDIAAPDESIECRYELIAGRGQTKLTAKAISEHQIRSDRDVLIGLAKKVATRKQRQRLDQELDLLRQSAEFHETATATDDEKSVIDAVRRSVSARDAAVQQLAQAVIASGLIDDRVRGEIEGKTRQYMEENAARLQAELDVKVRGTEAKVRDLQRRRDTLEDELASVRKQQTLKLEEELRVERDRCDTDCRSQRQAIGDEQAKLDQQRDLVKKDLAEVTRELSDAGESVVKRFLTIAPLLPHAQPGKASGGEQPRATSESAGAVDVAPLQLPPAVLRPRSPVLLDETAFFERFEKYVHDSGYQYHRLDLVAFHLSVKCGDLTILAGPPGIGKSVLPALYADALAGDESDRRNSGFLSVSVSPSWLDARDLFGHVNALERVFQPSETGLVRHLVAAVQERDRHGVDSGTYLTCLDEMNLAQVEHYASNLLPLLDAPRARMLRLFAPELVDARSPFTPYAAIELPRNVRFVGTVNLDETTRPLSQRLLDRANVVQLRPKPFANTTLADDGESRPCPGPTVTVGHLRQWTAMAGLGSVSASLGPKLAGLLDQLNPHLTSIGCGLNPRRGEAISKFIGSAPMQLCTAEQAMDMQIAQRLLPQVRQRGLFRREAIAAFDAVDRLLTNYGTAFEASSQLLREIRAEATDMDPAAATSGD